MKVVMKRWMKNVLAAMAIIVSGFLISDIHAEAEGEISRFGSESYEWVQGTESPIGVYVESDEPMSYVDMTLQYDPQMLQYNSGGELEAEGRVRISSGAGNTEQFSLMVYFTPLRSGTTQISITNVTVQYASGETSTATDASAPISVPLPAGCALSSLTVNGQPVPGFSPDVLAYSVDVANDIATANVEAVAEDAASAVQVSDTTLAVGTNTINVTVTNSSGNQVTYTVTVNRAEPVTSLDPVPEEHPDSDTADTEPTIQNALARMTRSQLIFAIILVVLTIILLLLIATLIQISRNKKRHKRRHAAAANHARSGGTRQPVKRRKPVERREDIPEVAEAANTESAETEKTPAAAKAEEGKQQAQPAAAGKTEDAKTAPAATSAGKAAAAAPAEDEREIEIDVQHVTMEFKREKDEATSIKELLIRTLKGQRSTEKFKALDDVSFTVHKGEVVGIIGTNGSGKSTILKIISGVLAPTQGKVVVDKNKIQLLTLGTGFDYELTGRENVYLNGAVIGYTKEFIDEKYDDIVKFAELEGFMEEKVRNYSSGMVSRLGFAIATIRDTPEILILDEVLSVGDMFFRQKSEKRVKEMMHGGSTVLIVSHSTSVIRNNCTKVVWIEKGHLRMVGGPKEVCAAYEKMNQG